MRFNCKCSLLSLLALFGFTTIAIVVERIFNIQDTYIYMLGFIVGFIVGTYIVIIVIIDKHLGDKYEGD